MKHPHLPRMLALGCLLAAPSAHATIEHQLALELRKPDPTCRSTEVMITYRSSHARGNRHGTLNERNGGYIGTCYPYRPTELPGGVTVRPSWILGGIHNSQRGSTFVAGPGLQFHSPRFLGYVGLRAGLELPFITYEHPRKYFLAYGILPVTLIGVSVHPIPYVSERLIIGIEQRRFGQGDERVKLNSFSIAYAF